MQLQPNNSPRFLHILPRLTCAACAAACALALVATHPALAAGKAAASSAAVAPAAAPAGEAEFEVVAPGDDLYRLLGLVQRGGLLQSAPRGGATRYEVALETGRAALALASKRAAQARVNEDATQALSDLLSRLRPELRRLDVDVDAALRLCRTPDAGARVGVSGGVAPGVLSLRDGLPSLSSRLRVSAAQDSRDRSVGDPFGGDTERSPSFFGSFGSNHAGAAFFERPQSGPRGLRNLGGAGGASLDVSGGVRVRAGFSGAAPSMQPSSLRVLGANSPGAALLAGNLGGTRSVGVGADINLLSGVTLSGDIARQSAGLGIGGASGLAGTRYGGAARLSGFNDRLSLSLNMSRLVPEERARLSQPQSTAGVGLALGGDRFNLNLLYQQLFGPASSGQPNRVIAGGVNISF